MDPLQPGKDLAPAARRILDCRGVGGFMINLPIINYYEHVTFLTLNHAHTASFGTYGMLAIALALFVWRGLVRPEYWRERWAALKTRLD